MAQYLLLIYGDQKQSMERYEQMNEEERNEDLGRWWEYTKELQDAGAHVAGEALHPVQVAKTVRVRDGEQLVTDGPFAETKEQLGGFYLIDVETEEEAVEWAAKMPNVSYGSIEVRPVMVFEEESG
jgi:hypothetical protein